MSSPVTANPDITLAFAVAPLADGERICFAARGSGLYRSDDDGASWTATPTGAAGDITAVAVSPAGAVDQTLFAGTTGAVLWSTDLGQTWQPVLLGSPPPLVSVLAVSPAFHDDGIVLAGTFEDGLYRSTDRGATWRRANVGLLDPSVLAIAISPEFAADQTALIGTASGLYQSATGGRSWRDLDGPWAAPVVAVAISPYFADDGLLVAGTEGAGLFESRDGGGHWRQVAEDLAEADIVRTEIARGSDGRAEVLVVTADGAIRSRSGEAAWIADEINLVPDEVIVSAIVLDQAGQDRPLLIGLASGAIRRVVAH